MSRISPAPRSSASRAHSTASRPVALVPARESTSPPAASIATTTACEPSRSASSPISSGRASAAELTETLSAPRVEQRVRVGDRAHAAADRERDREPLGDARDELDERRRAPRASPSRRGRRARRRRRRSRRRRARPGRRRRAGPRSGRPSRRARRRRRGTGSGAGEASLEEARAGRAALLRVELDAEEAARLAPPRRCPPSARWRRASRRRTSARSSTPRRPARPPPSRCAARGPRVAAPPGRAGCPSPATPPSSSDSSSASWRPRQMPSVGAACGDPLAQRLVEAARRAARPSRSPRSRRPGSTARSAAATSAGIGRRRARRRRAARSATTTERMLPGAVLADRDVHSVPFVDGMPVALEPDRGAQRAADGLERRLGDVVLVAAGRLDVEREPPRLREALEHVRGEARVALELELRTRAGRRGRPRRGRARRPSARPRRRSGRCRGGRRARGRAPRRARAPRPRPCGAAPVSRSPAPSSDEVEAGVEGELLEEVVVDARAGVRRARGRAVEPEPHARCASRRSRAGGGRGGRAGAATGRRPVERARERLEQQVVVLAVADRDADPVGEDPHDEPGAEQRRRRRASGSVDRDEEEVRRATAAARGRARAAPRASRSRSSTCRRDVGRRRERGERERGGERRDRQRRLPRGSARRPSRASASA